MSAMPEGLQKYSETAVFTEDTIPQKLRASHTTKAGVWAKINILEGTLEYRALDGDPQTIVLSSATPGIVAPLRPHCITPIGPVRFKVEFYR